MVPRTQGEVFIVKKKGNPVFLLHNRQRTRCGCGMAVAGLVPILHSVFTSRPPLAKL